MVGVLFEHVSMLDHGRTNFNEHRFGQIASW